MKNLKSIIMKLLFKTDEKQEQRKVLKPRFSKFRKPNHFRKSSF